MKEKQALMANGLAEPEANIYLTVLRSGQLGLTDIARLTKYNRTTLYPYIKRLLRDDYLLQTRDGKRIKYLAHSPQKILANAAANHTKLANAMPELEAVFRSVNQQPLVSVRNGERAVAALFREVAETALYIKSISSPSSYLQRLSLAEARHFDRLTEQNEVKPQVLCPGTPENIKALRPFAKSWIDIKLLPERMHSPMEFLLFNNTTLVTSWQQLEVTEIQSEDITQFFTALFDYYWNNTAYYQHAPRTPHK